MGREVALHADNSESVAHRTTGLPVGFQPAVNDRRPSTYQDAAFSKPRVVGSLNRRRSRTISCRSKSRAEDFGRLCSRPRTLTVWACGAALPSVKKPVYAATSSKRGVCSTSDVAWSSKCTIRSRRPTTSQAVASVRTRAEPVIGAGTSWQLRGSETVLMPFLVLCIAVSPSLGDAAGVAGDLV